MIAEETLQEPPLRAWGLRLLKGAVVLLAAWFTWRFFTHSGFDWSRLSERVAGRARRSWRSGWRCSSAATSSGTGATSWR